MDMFPLWSHESTRELLAFKDIVLPKKVIYGRKSQYAFPPTRDKLSSTAMNSSPKSSNDSKRTFALGATYQVKSRFHGRGKVLFAWGNNPEDIDCPKYLASSGTSKVIHVFTKDSDDRKNLGILDQIMPPGSSICTALSFLGLDWTNIMLCPRELVNSGVLVCKGKKNTKHMTLEFVTLVLLCGRVDRYQEVHRLVWALEKALLLFDCSRNWQRFGMFY